jgi:hypothetical protein
MQVRTGYSIVEIASQLNLSTAAVLTRLFRARNQLRAARQRPTAAKVVSEIRRPNEGCALYLDCVRLVNASGITTAGEPYLRVFLPNGVLLPGASIVRALQFTEKGDDSTPARYTLKLLSGQGTP